MQPNHSFTIYNASAGSGKTHTITKTYLQALLTADSLKQYRNILAITFTNKAVSEMKSRIIEKLTDFAFKKELQDDAMFLALVKETGYSPLKIREKAARILRHLIHDYAGFDLQTIDGFTHKLIRTFAHDLKLPMNFEVSLDTDLLISLAVDQLLAKAGADEILTEILVDFAIEKADDDKSWDVRRDLITMGKLLVQENQRSHITSFQNISLNQFKRIKEKIVNDKNTLTKGIKTQASSVIQLINESGLQFADFSSSYLPTFFNHISNGNFDVKFGNQWQTKLLNGDALYPKKTEVFAKEIIDTIQPDLANAFTSLKKQIRQHQLLHKIAASITPVSVLQKILQEINHIKKEENILPISEFNQLISNEIKNQPAPFIYERLGEKYHYYFIDEFQDTSTLQWQNLIPLIDNALASAPKNKLMLVGDPKQAIYRWRGGDPEQFINLINGKSPFTPIQAEVQQLPINYRSANTIVNFCNHLFTYASTLFKNETYSTIYKTGSDQKAHHQEEGYVQIEFLDKAENINRNEHYAAAVIDTINDLKKQHTPLSDICILVRKNKQGVILAEALTQAGIPVVSSESLLLKNNTKVQFLNQLIQLSYQPDNAVLKMGLLGFILNHNIDENDHYKFYKTLVSKNPQQLFQTLQKKYQIPFDFAVFHTTSLYESVEMAIDAFSLDQERDAYLQFYLDVIYEYTQKSNEGFSGFIRYWEQKEKGLSVVSNKAVNAISIMSIHKSKGLEFPIVIYPFADDAFIDFNKDSVWLPLNADIYGIDRAYISLNKDVANYGDTGTLLFESNQAAHQLDTTNLLYVALTRPEKQLYIICQKPKTKAIKADQSYNQLLYSFLQDEYGHQAEDLIFSKGEKQEYYPIAEKPTLKITPFFHYSRSKKGLQILATTGSLWETKQADAIEKGNVLHKILSFIDYHDQINLAVKKAVEMGLISVHECSEIATTLNKIVKHTTLHTFYTATYTIYNERDIITSDGTLLRPDRVCIDNLNRGVIIDYKTGKAHETHWQQLISYEDALKEMNLTITTKYLVYINDEIKVLSR